MQTCNLSWTHRYCPCKILPLWGKLKLWTFIVCHKFTSCSMFSSFLKTFLLRSWIEESMDIKVCNNGKGKIGVTLVFFFSRTRSCIYKQYVIHAISCGKPLPQKCVLPKSVPNSIPGCSLYTDDSCCTQLILLFTCLMLIVHSWGSLYTAYACCTQLMLAVHSWGLLNTADARCTHLRLPVYSWCSLCTVYAHFTRMMLVVHSWFLLYTAEACCTQMMLTALSTLQSAQWRLY